MEQLELISISSQESEDLHSHVCGSESKPSHSARSKNTLNESSEKTSQEHGYSQTFGHFQQLNFASLGSLPEDTRASLFPKLGSAEEQKTTVTSGLRCSELSDHQGQFGCFVKMLLVTSRWVSTKSSLIWKVKNTPFSRLLFQLSPSMRDTEETESGLWATPRACTAMSAENIQNRVNDQSPNLESQVAKKLWPKPNAWDGARGPLSKEKMEEGVHQITLVTAVKHFPTPTAPGKNQVGTIGEWGGSGNPLRTPETMTLKGGSLNPTWVEWLMGYAIGWTDLEDSETQSSLKSHTRSSEP